MKKKKWIIVLIVIAVLAIGGAIMGEQGSRESNTPVKEDKDAEKTEMNFQLYRAAAIPASGLNKVVG